MALPKCAELFNSLLNVLKPFDGKSGKYSSSKKPLNSSDLVF